VRKLLLILMFGSCGLSSTSAQSKKSDGTTLFQSCQHTIRLLDLGADKATAEDVTDSNYCRGYFQGFEDTIKVYGSAGVCLDDTRIGTVIRVYVAYMDKHPKLLDDLEIAGVIEAMHETYPCPAKLVP
jgi:Rap1a immunity proteins